MKATTKQSVKATKAAYNTNDKTMVQALKAKITEFCKANYNKKIQGDVTAGDIGVMDYHTINAVAEAKGIYKPYFQFLKIEEKRAAVLGLFSPAELDAVIASKRSIVEAKQVNNGESLAKYREQLQANKESIQAKLKGQAPKTAAKPIAKTATPAKVTNLRKK